MRVCLHVISNGLLPTDRDHCPSNVGLLLIYFVDFTVHHICILSDVDNNVLYQSDFFVGLENILRRTLEQLAEAYGGEHPA